ncbi:MAG: reverse transcriptase domain-containing protein [Methylococcales bacterium]
MKRTLIEVDAVAAWENLARAFAQAARGKQDRPDVCAFRRDLNANLASLSERIRAGRAGSGEFRRLVIHDPKRRIIHVPSFEERVLHHALMAIAGPVLERAMVANTYACLPGRGNHRAVSRVQQQLQRFAWFVKIDIAGYFDHIDHGILLSLLRRRFAGDGFLLLMEQIVRAYQSGPGRGLPIGTLVSQHLANYYLDGLDRWLAARSEVKAAVRYMDDVIWWCGDRESARRTLNAADLYLRIERLLTIKANPQINRSKRGVTFCGFRVHPGGLRLTPRRRRRYASRRAYWEKLWTRGLIDERTLQLRYAAVHAITLPADTSAWRCIHLARRGVVDA